MSSIARRALIVALARALVGANLAVPVVALAQPVATAVPANAQALARVRAERQSAEQALASATDQKSIAQAADRLRQVTSLEVTVATAGMTPDAAARVLREMSGQARARQDALGKTAREYLKNRLATAASDAERAAAYRSYDASITQLRITQEIADEALRRLNPVAQPTGYAGEPHREAYNSTQARMEKLLDEIAKIHVEQPRLPSYTNPDGSRATTQDREIEEHLRKQKRDADIQEYLRLADGGVFVDPKTGQPLSQEMRDRIAKNAKLALVDVLKANGIEAGAIRTLFGWTDSRIEIGRQIEESVRSNSWYQALDMLNPSVAGADPRMVALAMANVLRLSADQVYAWRAGQIPEGGAGGITGWLYENFWAKQKVGAGTAMRVKDLEKGGAIDKEIDAYTNEVDAAVKALNEMAKTPDPKDLSADSHRLLERLGFIAKADGKEAYRIPTGDTAERLKRNLDLPGATVLDLISGGNAIKVVLMVATPQLIAARVGVIVEGLELGAGAVRTGEFLATALANAGMDAGFQQWETGSVQWDRLILDTIVVNLGLGLVSEATGVVAKGVVGGLMSKEAQELAKTFAKNRASREMAESILSQTLGLYGDAALLTYWQGKFQATGMSYDDFLANLLNGMIGRVAPVVGRTGKVGLQEAILVSPRTLRDAIFGLSPWLRDAFQNSLTRDQLQRGLTREQLSNLVEARQFAVAEHARKQSTERLSNALGDDYLKMDLTDTRLVSRLTEALETGKLSFTDLKAVLGETPALTKLVDGVNAYRLKGFDEIVTTAKELARAEIQAEYRERMQKFKDNLGEGSDIYRKAEADTKAWRDAELAKVDEKIDAPGSKNNTSDVDRSITSAYLRNALKVATDEWFSRNRDGRAATSASAFDVNEYYHILKFIEFLKAAKLDLKTATHTLADGTTISHADLMEAMGLATAMMEMPPWQREGFQRSRTATGNRARMDRLFRIANESLAKADADLKAEVARLKTQGFDPDNADTITRARDNLYGKRAIELADKEATLRRLVAEKSPYAAQLAAELEADWAMTKREGIEAYTNFTGLEIIVSKAQMSGVTAREMIEGKVDTDALEAANAKRRKDGQPERTATQQQEMIDKAIADIRKDYSKGQFAGALDDQIRFMAHHINAFFEGHENATQVASALSKYAERTVLFMNLMGLDTTTGRGKELSDISKDLVKNRGDLAKLKGVVTGYGGGDENAGIRKLIGLLEQTVPGLKGLFEQSVVVASPSPGTTEGASATGTNSAALAAIRRDREIEREQLRRTGGSQAVVQSVVEHKSELVRELAQLEAAKAADARMATQYNRNDWKLARELEAEREALMLQLNAVPLTNPATATFWKLAEQIGQIDARLTQFKATRTATGAGQPTGAEVLRDKRIASLKQQVKDDDVAIARYDAEARKEAADAAARVASGNTNFRPVDDLARISVAKTSTTPELDKLGKYLAGEVEKGAISAPPPGTSATPARTATGTPGAALPPGANAPKGGDTTGGPGADKCASLRIAPDNRIRLTMAGVTYPGVMTARGFELFAPGTSVSGGSTRLTPAFVAALTPLPTGNVTNNPDGSVTYDGVPVAGLATTPAGGSSPGNTLSFAPPKKTGPTGTAGGQDSGGGVTIGGGVRPMGDLGKGPGAGWGERESFEPIPQVVRATSVGGEDGAVASVGPTTGALQRAQQLYGDPGGQNIASVPVPQTPAPTPNAVAPLPVRPLEPRMAAVPATPQKPVTPDTSTAPAPVTPQVPVTAATPVPPQPSATPPTSPTPKVPVAPVTPVPPQASATPQPLPTPKAPAPPTSPQPAPPNPGSSTVVPAPTASGFSGTWIGNGGCGFTRLGIGQQGNALQLQGLPGNGTIQATSDGNSAQAQGVVMFGKPNHQVTLFLQGNQIAFQASSSSGSCSDNLRRQ